MKRLGLTRAKRIESLGAAKVRHHLRRVKRRFV